MALTISQITAVQYEQMLRAKKANEDLIDKWLEAALFKLDPISQSYTSKADPNDDIQDVDFN